MRFLDVAQVRTNVKQVLLALGGDINSRTLKTNFVHEISSRQGLKLETEESSFVVDFGSPRILEFISSSGLVNPLSDLLPAPFTPDQKVQVLTHIAAATQLLQEADPALSQLMKSMVATFAVLNPNEDTDVQAGSISSAIGLVYLCPQPWWSSELYAEMMIHESVHNVIFLDDMANGIFPNLALLGHEDALVVSSLRHVKRPYDKSFHSACVAATLSYFYGRLGKEDKALEYLPALRLTIADLFDTDARLQRKGIEIVTDTGRAILEQISRFSSGGDMWRIDVRSNASTLAI